MLFKVNFINNKSENQKFIVSGVTKDKCKELAKNYINDLGGAIVLLSMKRIKSIE